MMVNPVVPARIRRRSTSKAASTMGSPLRSCRSRWVERPPAARSPSTVPPRRRLRWPRALSSAWLRAGTAALAGGLAFGTTGGRRGEPLVSFVEETGALVSVLVWLAFGAVALVPAMKTLTWAMVLYAILSLTVIRMVPVVVALVSAGLGWATVVVVAWFGPRAWRWWYSRCSRWRSWEAPPRIARSPSSCCSASSHTVRRPNRWRPGTRNCLPIAPPAALAPLRRTCQIAG